MKILVIEALGLHLGYLGCYGNDWVATPNLDRLAAEGIVFDNHIADQPELRGEGSWHDRSVAMGCHSLPGRSPSSPILFPEVVRIESLSNFASQTLALLDPSQEIVWLEGPSLVPPWKLEDEMIDAYFDEDDIEEGLAPWPDPALDLVKLNEADVLQLQNTYAAVVTVFDAQLGMIVDRLRETKLLDDLLLCVTARSGLPLGEHGMIGTPRPWLHAELVHVPLVMRLPKGEEAGLRIASLTQPVDLAVTFRHTTIGQFSLPAELTHGEGRTAGRSLWPLIRGEVLEIRPFAFSAMQVGGYECWLMRTLDAALHIPVSQPEGVASIMPQLFLKPEDRWEVNDLYQQQADRAEAMEKTLREFAVRA